MMSGPLTPSATPSSNASPSIPATISVTPPASRDPAIDFVRAIGLLCTMPTCISLPTGLHFIAPETIASMQAMGAEHAAADSTPAAAAPTLHGWRAMVEARGNPNDGAWIAGETAAFRDGPITDRVLFRAGSSGRSIYFTG